MKEILKLTLSLTLICAIAGTALAFVSQKTDGPRKKARLAQRNEKMKLLLPEETAKIQESPAGNGVTFFEARDNAGKVIAYCAESSDPNGFGGEVKVLVGFNLNGAIRGVLVSENSETPGIGSRACNRETPKSFWSLFQKSEDDTNRENALPPNSYLDSYNNCRLTGGEFQFGIPSPEQDTNNYVMPITGATISSTAIRNAVNRIASEAKNRISFTQE